MIRLGLRRDNDVSTPPCQPRDHLQSVVPFISTMTGKEQPPPPPFSKEPLFVCSHRFAVLLAYICVWTSFYLLVHYAGDGADVPDVHSNPSSLIRYLRSVIFIICVEMIKVLVSCALYLRQERSDEFPSPLLPLLTSTKMKKLSLNYLPVALLYAMYNNLMFLNLQSIHLWHSL